MDDEFEKMMQYFTLDQDEKVERLGEVFEYSIEFFKRLRHTLKEGTPEEQQEILKRAAELQGRIQQEMDKVCEETGLSVEELEAQAMNPDLYGEEEWDVIQHSREEIESQAHEIAKMVDVTGDLGPKLHKGPKKKKKRKAGPWLKS